MAAEKLHDFRAVIPECRLILWKDSANEWNGGSKSCMIFEPSFPSAVLFLVKEPGAGAVGRSASSRACPFGQVG